MFWKNPHKIAVMNEERDNIKMWRRLSFVGLIALLAFSIVGCSLMQKKNEEGTEVDYTVVKVSEWPEEIQKIIEEKKQNAFEMTYRCDGELYLMKGYGIQTSGGYSIQVEYIKETSDILHVKTQLIGPSSKEQKQEAVSCPMIVVKVEYRDKMIVFD